MDISQLASLISWLVMNGKDLPKTWEGCVKLAKEYEKEVSSLGQ